MQCLQQFGCFLGVEFIFLTSNTLTKLILQEYWTVLLLLLCFWYFLSNLMTSKHWHFLLSESESAICNFYFTFLSVCIAIINLPLWFCKCRIWFVMSLNNLPQTQEKRMDELNLFIEHYSKYIVSIIWQRYVLTLHLFHANCCKAFNISGSCCQFAPTHYVISIW